MFDWQAFHFIAQHLNNNCDDIPDLVPEAAYRSAISRAYYAAYNTANQFAKNEFQATRSMGGGSHKKLINLFNEFKNENDVYQNIAKKLHRMREYRNSADYKDTFPKTAPYTAARLTIRLSQEVILTLHGIDDNPPK